VPTAMPIAANIKPILDPQITWLSFKKTTPLCYQASSKHRFLSAYLEFVLMKYTEH
jgi:hypothetical protein